MDTSDPLQNSILQQPFPIRQATPCARQTCRCWAEIPFHRFVWLCRVLAVGVASLSFANTVYSQPQEPSDSQVATEPTDHPNTDLVKNHNIQIPSNDGHEKLTQDFLEAWKQEEIKYLSKEFEGIQNRFQLDQKMIDKMIGQLEGQIDPVFEVISKTPTGNEPFYHQALLPFRRSVFDQIRTDAIIPKTSQKDFDEYELTLQKDWVESSMGQQILFNLWDCFLRFTPDQKKPTFLLLKEHWEKPITHGTAKNATKISLESSFSSGFYILSRVPIPILSPAQSRILSSFESGNASHFGTRLIDTIAAKICSRKQEDSYYSVFLLHFQSFSSLPDEVPSFCQNLFQVELEELDRVCNLTDPQRTALQKRSMDVVKRFVIDANKSIIFLQQQQNAYYPSWQLSFPYWPRNLFHCQEWHDELEKQLDAEQLAKWRTTTKQNDTAILRSMLLGMFLYPPYAGRKIDQDGKKIFDNNINWPIYSNNLVKLRSVLEANPVSPKEVFKGLAPFVPEPKSEWKRHFKDSDWDNVRKLVENCGDVRGSYVDGNYLGHNRMIGQRIIAQRMIAKWAPIAKQYVTDVMTRYLLLSSSQKLVFREALEEIWQDEWSTFVTGADFFMVARSAPVQRLTEHQQVRAILRPTQYRVMRELDSFAHAVPKSREQLYLAMTALRIDHASQLLKLDPQQKKRLKVAGLGACKRLLEKENFSNAASIKPLFRLFAKGLWQKGIEKALDKSQRQRWNRDQQQRGEETKTIYAIREYSQIILGAYNAIWWNDHRALIGKPKPKQEIHGPIESVDSISLGKAIDHLLAAVEGFKEVLKDADNEETVASTLKKFLTLPGEEKKQAFTPEQWNVLGPVISDTRPESLSFWWYVMRDLSANK